ncbi:MAG: L-asparaginase / beta-aspartyl-peptidase, partial [Thermoleophilaceae bacterium]|nr:L-asparaginase / beta-aspartyl-peptidase [Thermoleophilaceae bacterium]
MHGGAGGRVPRDEAPYREALALALEAGWAALERFGPVDAVQAAVELLEDAPLFNAGRGSVLTAAGAVEMDAAIAGGPDRRTGAVACVTRVRNPVRLARVVMDRTPHVLLAGRGAEALAVEHDLETMKPEWFVTPHQRERLRHSTTEGNEGGGTVGAVARGADGVLAAATSTGGVRGQLPGRVGDSPVFGAGTYADDRCAVSATGDGEAVIRSAGSYELARLVGDGVPLADAADRVMRDCVGSLGGSGGLIALGAEGD